MSFYDIEELKGQVKKPSQRVKHFLVLQYLMRETDDEHFASTDKIVEFLKDQGIYAERRSIYKDIEDINIAMVMLEEDCDYETATQIVQEDEEAKTIGNKHKKGFYVRRRTLDANDVRLIAECIYSAKFISKREGDFLIEGVSNLLSQHQKENIKHDVHLVGRIKTDNKEIIDIVDKVNTVIQSKGKISFKYQTHVIQDTRQQVERRRGERYAVSPYVLLIDNGNYYMMAYDDSKHDIRTYRVDRMKNVEIMHEPREGAEEFEKIDIESYLQRSFSMYHGKDVRVEIRFLNHLLDTAIDKFGKDNVFYRKIDDRHFSVSAHVEVSDQFFAWVTGFGKKAKIIAPESVIQEYKDFLEKIRESYN